MVHHADSVVVDGIGDGDGRMAHARRTGGARLAAIHIRGDGVEQRSVVVAGQHGHRFQVALARLEHEAGIGAADVGQQAWPFTESLRRIAACYFHFSSIFMAVPSLVCVRCHGGALSLWQKPRILIRIRAACRKMRGTRANACPQRQKRVAPAEKSGPSTGKSLRK